MSFRHYRLILFIGDVKKMVYKIGNVCDLKDIPIPNSVVYDVLYEYLKVLTFEYGQSRNVDTDDGGYVLFAEDGTLVEDIKAYFDYSKHIPEYVNRSGEYCSAVYLLNNEFAVTIVMSINDAPKEISDYFEEGY